MIRRLLTSNKRAFVRTQQNPLFIVSQQHNCRALFHTSTVARSILDEGEKALVFTCSSCGHQQAHAFSTAGFEQGVVTLICPKCKEQHNIADHIGFYEDPRNIDDFETAMGPHTKKRFEKKVDLGPEDLKELGLYEKVMERKAELDKKKAAENPVPPAAADKK
jgi:predicted RNA-binding Zn-ribbon protein involved in translation (DUF1610 family)